MLHTNLSTRPFYNDRTVKALLAVVVLLTLGLTLFNAAEILQLQGQTADARETISRNDTQVRELRAKAAEIRRSVDAAKLAAVQTAAREANALIDRRTFSWTELLNHFQSTLPPDVRIAGVMPQIDSEGRRLVQISVFSRRLEDLEVFMDALEKTGAFSGVLPRSDHSDDDGVTRSELQAYYTPTVGRAADAPPAKPESGKSPANATPSANASAGVPR
jgi:DNA-binding transcriptional MerR regulator